MEKIKDLLRNAKRVFLDTAPIIYYIEKNERYFDLVRPVFDHLDNGLLVAITSPVTLAECLIHPCNKKQKQLEHDFFDLIVNGSNTIFTPFDHTIACRAAQLRAYHNLTLTDAFQIATALFARCDVFLTNDIGLKRVDKPHVIILEDMKV